MEECLEQDSEGRFWEPPSMNNPYSFKFIHSENIQVALSMSQVLF